jgi:hypothetical protein
VSIFLCKLWILAAPIASLACFNHLVGSTPYLAEWEVNGHVFGKHATTAPATDTRAILPLPSVLIIVDTALSR